MLWLMLTDAASLGSRGEEQIAHARSDPDLRAHGSEWGTKKGDLGVVALDGLVAPIGAAWLRLDGAQGPYKLGDRQVPELAMAVIPPACRRRVGSRMMQHLIRAAKPHYPQIVLSVRAENPAVSFYSEFGFREALRMTNRVGGDSLVMLLDMDPAAQHQDAVGGIQDV